MDLFNVLFARRHGIAPNGDFFDTLLGRKLGDSGVWELENAPYFFRRAGGLLNSRLLGKEKDKLVGGSVGWNELAKGLTSTDWSSESGVSATYSDGVATISSTSANNGIRSDVGTLVGGHKYLAQFSVKGTSGLTVRYLAGSILKDHAIQSNSWETEQWIASVSTTATSQRLYINGRSVAYSDMQVNNVNLIDLTLMLGSTIADYAYTLETQQAGKGVKWLKDYGFFSEPYYAYDIGSIKSVSGLSAHKCVGFNAFSDTFVIGKRWGDDGAIASTSDKNACMPNKIKCLPNTEYCFSLQDMSEAVVLYVSEWDGGENHIQKSTGVSFGTSPNYKTFTTGANTHYIAISLYRSGNYFTATDLEKANLNISNADLNGQYKPYHADTYPLDSTVELRGLFKMDADHNLYADGDTYESSGVVTRNMASVDMGTLNWAADPNRTGVFYASILDKRPSHAVGEGAEDNGVITAEYALRNASVTTSEDKYIADYPSYSGQSIFVRDTAYSTASDFKTAMNGKTLWYYLATPTTETADPFTNPQTVDKDGTEEYVTNQSFVPIGHSTEYKCAPLP